MIILSVTARTVQAAMAEIRSSARYADMIELRLDLIRPGRGRIGELIRAAHRPVIATCRPRWEGGSFTGSERERARVLEAAARAGARYLDIELQAWPSLVPALGAVPVPGLIASVHHFGPRHPRSERVYENLRGVKADVVKYAFMASDIADVLEVQRFLEHARRDARPAIAIAMGPDGELSRILYRKLGSWATYGSPVSGRPSAPGQPTVAELRELYRAHQLGSRTRVFGVVGNPVAQSKGVQIHNRLLYGDEAVYCRLRVRDLRSFMASVAPLLAGFSVTIPYKEAILPYLDTIDRHARAIGAANTVVKKRGRFWGTNCDGRGALEAIERTMRVRGKVVLILGAGGTARAIASEARRRGATVVIAGRTMSRTRRLAREFGARAVPLESAGEEAFDILVNATSIGMAPRERATPIRASSLRGKVVFDAVYNPPHTRLLREARRVGARTVAGTAMFINQAAMQFRLFTGRDPDRGLMERTLKRALATKPRSRSV